jgi:nitrous oxidase accessory protein NosD
MRESIWIKGLIFGIILLIIGASMVSGFNLSSNSNIQPSTRGNWLYVGGSGLGNYTTIQSAIDAASTGDTIFVYHGIYYENIAIAKRVNLVGENKNTTIIDGSRKDSVVFIVHDDVTITGFTIQNGSLSDYPHAGVEIHSINTKIIDNIISDNYVGVHPLYAGPFNTWGNNTFMHNIIVGNHDAAFCIHCCNSLIFRNQIENNALGIFFQVNAIGNRIEQNNFVKNNESATIYRGWLTRWINNYWDDWVGLKHPAFKVFPKTIWRVVPINGVFIEIPWCDFDWHPAKQPYDIPRIAI